MNRIARWMMRLYPPQWRARYGDEVDALITDTGADARTVADLARGGVRMQLSTWSFPKLTLTLGLIGLLLGAALSLLLPSEYTSKATMQMTPARIDAALTSTDRFSNPLNENILQIETQILSRARLTSIIEKLNLYPGIALDDSLERLKNSLRISFVAGPPKLRGHASAFDIVFTYPDRYKAQQTVEALMSTFDEINMTSSLRTTATTAGAILVLDEASLPEAPFSPSGTVVVLGAFLAGVLLATLWLVIQRRGFIARRFALVAMTLGAIGIIAVVTMDRMEVFPYQYRSRATLRLNRGTNDQAMALIERVRSRDSLSAIINNPRFLLYRDEARTKSPDDILALMRSHLWVSLQGNHGGAVFDVVFDYKDRYKARQVVEALTDRFRSVSAGTFPESAATSPQPAGYILDVLDIASLPTTPSKPHRPMIALAGAFWGIVFGAIISIIRRRWTPPSIAPLNAVNG